MFGKKKKLAKQQAELEAAQRAQEEQERLQREREQQMQQSSLDDLIQENKVFVESELIDDDDVDSTQEFEAIAYILKQEEGDALVAKSVDEPEEESAPAQQQDVATAPVQEPVREQEPMQESVQQTVEQEQQEEEVELEEVEETPVAQPVAPREEEEEVVYVVDGEEDDDEHVKAAKLVKLPNLIDYMLMQNMTKRMKLNVATLLLSAYQRYKDEPEERKIIVKCMSKVMQALMQ